ncbi:MAG: macro domain-containing protein [Sphaerochaetaceae bacterium]|nr:macro domain-containing protein [Sphaerochaetaceae bacterium]NLO59862.1 RNase III inhibitor [Spirochaetales bacterium]MDD2406713.1 macro domain-containing protein [Sphaerochaetaceae bacterium]MDD3671221.1 macro domain-containing protein [Sphaerochaetaceae bacterium]MDD4259743.1 macro domain-containing protein [Sphaerochaetaceae bacterium]
MPFHIVHNNIVTMEVDAIVNAANTRLKAGGGVCGAIFHAAGTMQLQLACDRIGYCATGDAVATEAFNLTANYIIHTPGPVYVDGKHGEERLLRSCYVNSLALATKLGCHSIAFPLISAGIYGYPRQEALHVASSSITSFVSDQDLLVYLVLFP